MRRLRLSFGRGERRYIGNIWTARLNRHQMLLRVRCRLWVIRVGSALSATSPFISTTDICPNIARGSKGADSIAKQRQSLKNGKQIVTLALAICWPLLNPRLRATQSSCRPNYLFLLTSLTYLSGRLANPASINLSIRSSRSLPSTFRAIFLLWRRARSMHSLMILQHDR